MKMSEAVGSLYAVTEDASALHAWTVELRKLTRARPPEDWRRPLFVLAQGITLFHAAGVTEDPDHIDAALAVLRAAKDSVAPTSGVYGTASLYAAKLYMHRYVTTLDPTCVEIAVLEARVAAGHDRISSGERYAALLTLARSLGLQHSLTHSIEHLPLALTATEQALAVAYSADADPAEALSARGYIARQLYRITGSPAALEKAVTSYRSLVESCRGSERLQKAAALDCYGNILMDRYERDGDLNDLARALAQSRTALAVAPEGSAVRTRVLSNLGTTLHRAHRSASSVFAGALEESVQVLRTAAAEAECDPQEASIVFARLGSALGEAASDGPEGLPALDEAIAAFEKAQSLLHEPDALPVAYQLGQQRNWGELVEHHVALLVRRARLSPPVEDAALLRRAMEIGEQAKSRMLARAVGATGFDPPSDVPDHLRVLERTFAGALASLDTLEFTDTGSLRNVDPRLLMRRRRMLCGKLTALWAQMEEHSAGGAAYVALRRGAPGALLGMLAEDRAAAYVSLMRARGLVALVLLPGSDQPLVVSSDARGDPVPDAVRRFTAEVPMDRGQGLREETWDQRVVALLRSLAEEVGKHAGPVVVSPPPHGLDLPWHLVLERSGCLHRDADVTLLPSLALTTGPARITSLDVDEFSSAEEILDWLQRHERGTHLVVGDPTGDLAFAGDEARMVGRLLGVEALVGAAADVETVIAAIEHALVVHLAAHARLDSSDPLNSALHLADGEVQARVLMRRHMSAELVVLSACESAATAAPIGGEVTGLAYALLRAGAGAVVASLWPVDDEATTCLMGEFYAERERLGSDGRPEAALAAAMRRVRCRPQWRHPYFWAGFVVIGRGRRHA
ncbi:CHAT domain-containing protein [Streptomyces tricolor]